MKATNTLKTRATSPEAESDNFTLYPTGDNHKISLPWIIKDYDEKGALSTEQKQELCDRFNLDAELIDKLSIYVGNCLDTDSSLVFYSLTKSRSTEKALKLIRKGLRHLKAGVPDEHVRKMFKDTSAVFAQSEEDMQLVAAIFNEREELKEVLKKLLHRPGALSVTRPDNAKKIHDTRRIEVVNSCCYVLKDAGRPLSVTTASDGSAGGTRRGEVIELIKMIIGMVTSPRTEVSVETLKKDIDYFKIAQNAPDFLTEEPEFGR